MSYETDRYGLKKLASQSLAVVECGIQICHAGHISPPITYKNYSAHFILEGKGSYKVNGKSYELHAGEGFMITPGASSVYVADREQPWKYVYASFCGTDADALVHHAGLDEENVIFSFPTDEGMIRDIYAMHAAGKRNEAKGYDVTGYFLLCMSRLVRANQVLPPKRDATEEYVRSAILYIEDHYPFRITISDVAFHVGLDRTYLYRLFCRRVGCSPSSYLTNTRLKRAAELLESGEMPISEIGVSVGFHDASHFYKVFSAKYGMTPKIYQESKRQEIT